MTYYGYCSAICNTSSGLDNGIYSGGDRYLIYRVYDSHQSAHRYKICYWSYTQSLFRDDSQVWTHFFGRSSLCIVMNIQICPNEAYSRLSYSDILPSELGTYTRDHSLFYARSSYLIFPAKSKKTPKGVCIGRRNTSLFTPSSLARLHLPLIYRVRWG